MTILTVYSFRFSTRELQASFLNLFSLIPQEPGGNPTPGDDPTPHFALSLRYVRFSLVWSFFLSAVLLRHRGFTPVFEFLKMYKL